MSMYSRRMRRGAQMPSLLAESLAMRHNDAVWDVSCLPRPVQFAVIVVACGILCAIGLGSVYKLVVALWLYFRVIK